MNLAFPIMYALGLTPWDHGQVPDELRQLVGGLPRGRALDAGCGSGTQALWLAGEGFDVVGVDVVHKAIDRARRRVPQEGARVTFLAADVGADPPPIAGPFELILDYGCLHSLGAKTRNRLAQAYARLAGPGATLLLFGMSPRRGPGPAGLGRDELDRRFGQDWDLIEARPDRSTPMPRLLRGVDRTWYRLQRHP
jgi:SAM-dependent methyltransferase